MTLALFDFDGTIVQYDSLLKFIRFVVGDLEFIFGLFILSPMLVVYKLKLIPNDKAKQWMLSYYFKGMHEHKLKKAAKEFSLKKIDTTISPKALKEIKWHKEQGHKIVIVSASMECWLKPWCEKYNLEILSTKLEFINNLFTGKFATKNCYGIEKVNRIKENYNLDEYDVIYAYGDSKGDKEMLELAQKKYYKYFE
jgi:HAD superfamily hydrolase (TIGR01490 family)